MPMVDTLTRKAGPLPVWAWAGIGTAGLAWYMSSRKKAAAAAAAAAQQPSDSSNLGTVPVSNLTTDAQPMPIQMGDTFVNVNDGDGDGDDGGKTTTPLPPKSPNPGGTLKKPPPPAKKAPTPTKPAPSPATQPQQKVTVCPWPQWCGSLWGIAQHFYGNGALWPQIYNANKAVVGSNPNLIYAGQQLVIPPK